MVTVPETEVAPCGPMSLQVASVARKPTNADLACALEGEMVNVPGAVGAVLAPVEVLTSKTRMASPCP